MYRILSVLLMLVTLSFTGCQDAEPSKIIVSLQIDSDANQTWIYLYTIPRVKMDNFTISLNDENETLTSVFSHQKGFLNKDVAVDSEGFLIMRVQGDLSEVSWDYNCKVKIYTNLEDNLVYADFLTVEEGEEIIVTEQLPYNVALDYQI